MLSIKNELELNCGILARRIVMEEKNLENEIDDLRQELEHFQQEKERVRTIVGKIGGVPKFNTKLVNLLFIGATIGSLIVSLVVGEKWRLLMIELATVAISLKILYMMHCQERVNHFKFWILSSIEWRLNEVTKRIKNLER